MQEEASAHKASHLSAALRAPRALTPLVLFMGFLGATLRYLLELALPSQGGVPYATLIVNVFGCFTLEIINQYVGRRLHLPGPLVKSLGIGLVGAFNHALCLFDRMPELLPQWRGWTCNSVYHHNDCCHILCVAVWEDRIKLPGIAPPTAHTKKNEPRSVWRKTQHQTKAARYEV